MQTSTRPGRAMLAPLNKSSTHIRGPCTRSVRGLNVASRPLCPSVGLSSSLMQPQQRIGVVMHAGDDDRDPNVNYNKEFGYSRKDIILIGVGLFAIGFILYYGLQAQGMDAGMAGNWVQLLIFLGICVGWIGSYLYRVANKQMTYVKQLEDYEEAVMKKRLEEMPDVELETVMEDVEREKKAIEERRAKR